jgi:hypothetical protein
MIALTFLMLTRLRHFLQFKRYWIMDSANGLMAILGSLLLLMAGLLSWVTLLLLKVGHLERELAARRRWWERSQRESRRD